MTQLDDSRRKAPAVRPAPRVLQRRPVLPLDLDAVALHRRLTEAAPTPTERPLHHQLRHATTVGRGSVTEKREAAAPKLATRPRSRRGLALGCLRAKSSRAKPSVLLGLGTS
jgi:hypothetical protein